MPSKEQGIERTEERGCPCIYTEPCYPTCTCRYPHSSTGCARCCRYGSVEQRTAKAEFLARKEKRAQSLRLQELERICEKMAAHLERFSSATQMRDCTDEHVKNMAHSSSECRGPAKAEQAYRQALREYEEWKKR